MSLDEFFLLYAQSRLIFDTLQAVIATLGPVDLRVTKSQVAFRRRRAFAWAWIPDQYLGGGHAPLVLSLAFHQPDTSPRWKQIVEPAAGRFLHHLELYSPADIDGQVQAWLQQAWDESG